jgi:NADH:ubiquinone reductase (H+-translocating)
MAKPERVLIVGGGFGGVKTALELAGDPRFDITLLTEDTDFRYYPTLFHTATGGKRANSSIPLQAIFTDRPVKLIQGKAVSLDRKAKAVIDEKGQAHAYDTLVIGLGVITNYFGIDGLSEYSYSIKSQAEVERFKAHLHRQLTDEHRPDLHYVIVGAGPTGIELAGALPVYLKYIMKNHGIASRKVHVDLIEAAPRLLPRLPRDVSRRVGRRLRRLGIRLYIGSTVQGQTADTLTVSGKPIRSHTVIWTAGVTNHPFFSNNHFVIMGRGKVAVDTYLQAEDNIFVIGDNANTPFSGMAQTALHDGEFVARNLRRRAAGKSFRSYIARQPITVIPAGPHWAVVIGHRVHIQGWRGWLVEQASYIIGFHDLEPWPKATRQFLTEFTEQEECPVCAAAQAK